MIGFDSNCGPKPSKINKESACAACGQQAQRKGQDPIGSHMPRLFTSSLTLSTFPEDFPQIIQSPASTQLNYLFLPFSLIPTPNMSSSSSSSSGMISSQSIMLAAAMLVSTTVIYLACSWDQKETPTTKPILRSCLHSEEKKRERRKKKRVCFAGNVKESKGNGEEYRREQQRKKGICRNQMPANRIALYHGILRDRIHRVQPSC